MQRTTYLVDSENVNDAWLKLLPQLKRKDRILIFYTENSPHFTAESARMITECRDKEITWVKCFTGRNALDFQMVSRLGYLICQFPQDAYVLMSNDNGFDAVVRYWRQESVSISRIRGNLRAMSGVLAEEERQRVERQRMERQQMERQQRAEAQSERQEREKEKDKNKGKGQTQLQELNRQPEKRWKEGWSLKLLLFGRKKEPQQEEAADTLQKTDGTADEGQLLSKPESSKEKPESSKGKPESSKGKPESSKGKPRPGTERPKAEAASKPRGEEREQRKNVQDAQAAQDVQDKQDAQAAQEAKPSKEIPVSCVLGICRSIPIHKLERIHEALIALLGAEDGREVYHFLKDNKEFHEKLKAIYLKDQDARVMNYLQVVFGYHGIEAERMEEIIGILKKYQSGNFNGMYKAMTGSFGQKKGARYYAVLKPHIRVIKKL